MTENKFDDLYKEFDDEFNTYKYYLYNEYEKTNTMNYKNILMTSILNRSLALIEAYKLLLPSNNLMALNSLSRLQIDNCIFIYGVKMLIDDGHTIDEIGDAIIKKNKKLSEYKIGKNKLYDTYIISELNKKFKCKIEDMCNFYCRYIHFSDSALLFSTPIKDENILSIEFSKDYSKFKKHVRENANSFSELNKFILILLEQEWKNIPNGKKFNK